MKRPRKASEQQTKKPKYVPKANTKANANFYVTAHITCENEYSTLLKQTKANAKANENYKIRPKTNAKTNVFFFVCFFGKNKTLKLLGQLTEKGYITKFGNGRGTRYKRNA